MSPNTVDSSLTHTHTHIYSGKGIQRERKVSLCDPLGRRLTPVNLACVLP